MKTISILGSTGSIGTQALEVAEKHNFKISALSAANNVKMLENQVRKYNPEWAITYYNILLRILIIL